MFKPDKIILHCSATKPEWMFGHNVYEMAAEIHRWHQERGFDMIGYHYLIAPDGEVAAGRPEWMQGAHCRDGGQNSLSIGICLIGGYGSHESDRFSQHFTDAQYMSVLAFADEYGLPMFGHNEFAAKACPGFNVQREFG